MKVPKLTTKSIQNALDRGLERVAASRKDEEDHRCLRGKYAPSSGTCRVCGGSVVGIVRFQRTGMIGGPPPPAYVSHWSCEGCGVMYDRVPTRQDTKEK